MAMMILKLNSWPQTWAERLRNGNKLNKMKKLKKETGQVIIEYALLVAAVALLIIPSMLYMAYAMEDLFMRTGSILDAPPPELSTTPPVP